ncbi:MAG: hypothetical protein QM736_18855 [Vicinamibacterales bacterium]
MSQDEQQIATTGKSDTHQSDRRTFLEGFGKVGMVALPFATMMLSSRNALAQSGTGGGPIRPPE